MNPTSIEWVDQAWNPVTGCRHGCSFCYARQQANMRAGNPKMDKYSNVEEKHGDAFAPFIHIQEFDDKRHPVAKRKPQTVFVSSMGDLFGEWVPRYAIENVLTAVEEADQHTFFLLTKNPARYDDFEIPENAWCGTSACFGDTKWGAQQLVDLVHATPRGRRFVSLEPLKGAVSELALEILQAGAIDWVIVGPETGPGGTVAQPEAEWVVEVEEACREADIPVFHKDKLELDRDGDWRRQEFPELKEESR